MEKQPLETLRELLKAEGVTTEPKAKTLKIFNEYSQAVYDQAQRDIL